VGAFAIEVQKVNVFDVGMKRKLGLHPACVVPKNDDRD
jgi:hypothetical protein